MRQNYDKKFLQNILDQYDGLGRINRFFIFTSGFENSNYFIKTEIGKFVIKIFEGDGLIPENILYELAVMDFSFRAGIKTPEVLKNQGGGLATIIKRKHACVMNYIEGQNMDKCVLSDKLAAEVGREAGKMDVALKYFKDAAKTRRNYEWDIKAIHVLEKLYPLLPKKFDQKIFREILQEAKKIYPRFIKMPTGLIHNDIVPHNWLVQAGRLNGIIDFSDMEFSPYIQNVAVSLHLICFCYNYNPGQAKIFLKNYRRFNSLSDKEIRLLYILVKVRFISFIAGFNSWNIKYGIDRQRVEAIDDHYKFLKRFIKIGQVKFNKMIGV